MSAQPQRLSLPAWWEAGLKADLILRNVITRWNSTYDMFEFTLRYREVVGKIGVNKKLPQFRKYELNETHWKVTEDLVITLEVVYT